MSNGKRENLGENLGHSNLEIVEADIAGRGDWEKKLLDIDWVIHLAAPTSILESQEKPRLYLESIIVGTFNVLEASRKYKIKRFIYVNSAACFGIADKYPTPENAPKKPQYPYALMKWLGEELAIHWSQVYDLPVISLRFFNLYGKRASALFGLFVSKKLDGNPLTITGDGTQTRDFTYIGDIVDGIYTAAMSEKVGEIYNIGSGKTVSVNKIAELFEAEIEYIPRRSGEMDITYGDITKAKKELNWKPKMGIEEGIPLVLKEIFNQKK